MSRLAALLLALVVLVTAGCDRPQRTVDQLRTEIAAYRENPSDAAQQKIETDLATLDAQIKKLDAKGDAAAATGFRSTAENLRADYRTARMLRTMKDTQSALQGIGQAVKDAGKSIGDAFRDSPSPTP